MTTHVLATPTTKKMHCRQCPLATTEARPGHFFRRAAYENALTLYFLAGFGVFSIVGLIAGVLHAY